MPKPKNIILLGSTGSIGTSAFKIAERHPDRFRLIALACGQNANAMLPQIRKFKPLLVSVKDDKTLGKRACSRWHRLRAETFF
jgi:1-deoxy-D-xylulose-5-phosphate reductoisomerase